MAKGIGLIGNFKGKVGNMVGYKLSDSNTGNSQGIRVYQPIVRNPKTSAQAEQRAKLAPINATYRALKMVIDRGNEGLPYGNKSRLAWLKTALKVNGMPWFIKGTQPTYPIVCPLTKGSLAGLNYSVDDGTIEIDVPNLTEGTAVDTVAAVSKALMAGYNFLKEGDQITIVALWGHNIGMETHVFSFVLSTTDTSALSGFTAGVAVLTYGCPIDSQFGSIIISREGDNGAHLRSTSNLKGKTGVTDAAPYNDTSKAAAINSYMSSASANSDWAEESIQ